MNSYVTDTNGAQRQPCPGPMGNYLGPWQETIDTRKKDPDVSVQLYNYGICYARLRMSPKMGGAIVITKLGRWTTQMLATGLTISGIVACSTQPAATNPELQPVEEMANNPEPVEPTTFKCDWQGGQWGTFAQRSNAVSTTPMISWNSREFGDNWKPERRCETVSERFTKAVANNGGMLSSLYLTTGKMNNLTVVCFVKQKPGTCNEDNLLFTLNKNNSKSPSEVHAQIKSRLNGLSVPLVAAASSSSQS
ncbi:MAG: COP23 domain-containing protein [Hormoscilla sp. GUM202]|nr:COP23 domain-containing protein [Hormoscilla sp. GUM202]